MRAILAVLLALSFALAGCGSSASKATGPTAPIILICNESTTDSTSGATSGTTATNNCDKSPAVFGAPVEE